MEVGISKGKRAVTNYKTLEIFENNKVPTFSLVECNLETGRTHQIRVHAAHIGHPIIGDPIYSRCRKLPIDLCGQVLHAKRLDLNHPITNIRMEFEAPLPETFENLLSILRKIPLPK